MGKQRESNSTDEKGKWENSVLVMYLYPTLRVKASKFSIVKCVRVPFMCFGNEPNKNQTIYVYSYISARYRIFVRVLLQNKMRIIRMRKLERTIHMVKWDFARFISFNFLFLFFLFCMFTVHSASTRKCYVHIWSVFLCIVGKINIKDKYYIHKFQFRIEQFYYSIESFALTFLQGQKKDNRQQNDWNKRQKHFHHFWWSSELRQKEQAKWDRIVKRKKKFFYLLVLCTC